MGTAPLGHKLPYVEEHEYCEAYDVHSAVVGFHVVSEQMGRGAAPGGWISGAAASCGGGIAARGAACGRACAPAPSVV